MTTVMDLVERRMDSPMVVVVDMPDRMTVLAAKSDAATWAEYRALEPVERARTAMQTMVLARTVEGFPL